MNKHINSLWQLLRDNQLLINNISNKNYRDMINNINDKLHSILIDIDNDNQGDAA